MKGYLFGMVVFSVATAAAATSMYLTENGEGTYVGNGPEALTANVLQSFESVMSKWFPDLFTNGG